MATFAELNAIAQTACDAWSHALQTAYGKKAGDARYDKRGWSTPELKALRDAYRAASAARHSAWALRFAAAGQQSIALSDPDR